MVGRRALHCIRGRLGVVEEAMVIAERCLVCASAAAGPLRIPLLQQETVGAATVEPNPSRRSRFATLAQYLRHDGELINASAAAVGGNGWIWRCGGELRTARYASRAAEAPEHSL